MRFPIRRMAACLTAMSVAALLASSAARAQGNPPASAPTGAYEVTPLVTDASDASLKNPWGLSRGSTSPWWVSDNATGQSTLYDGTGKKLPLTVTVPGNPTATLFNPSAAFAPPGTTAASRFLFVSLDGRISGWNAGTEAQVLTTTAGAEYTGATAATVNGQRYLYAADFHNGRIDVFDPAFNKVDLGAQAFQLTGVTDKGYAPFNIQNIGGLLFVTFSQQDANKQTDVHGAGLGYLAAFTRQGQLVLQYEHGDWFNSGWGLALAPSDFGAFSHDLLVGMFGGGQIAAFNLLTGKFDGLLMDANGQPIAIPGLWGIGFGNGGAAGPFNTLYFTAGPSAASGVFGTVTLAPKQTNFGNAR